GLALHSVPYVSGPTQAACHPELPMKKVTRRALRGHFHSPVVPAGHGNLRRIRSSSRRALGSRILRLRSQARFAQDDTALRNKGSNLSKSNYEATDSARAWSPIHVPRMRASYGPKSGPKAGSRASSPGEQAAACDYQKKTRALGRGASRSLRLHKKTRALGYARDL